MGLPSIRMHPDHEVGWSAIGGVIAVLSGSAALVAINAGSGARHKMPEPALALALLGVATGLALAVAALVGRWPFRRDPPAAPLNKVWSDAFLAALPSTPPFERTERTTGDDHGTHTAWAEVRHGVDAEVTPPTLELHVDMPPAIPSVRDYSERSAAQIWDFYEGRTELQGEPFIAPFREKWLHETGIVFGVAANQVQVHLDGQHPTKRIVLFFDEDWRDRLLTLASGSRISFDAQIQKITSNTLYLRSASFEVL